MASATPVYKVPDPDHVEIVHSTVLIVGAGPVGLLLALKLAKANINVTVIEKERAVSKSPRAAT
jgi:NADPH-dependent 2,4-dienoyl-CoA reductase/sulfur reductase-like enzyme